MEKKRILKRLKFHTDHVSAVQFTSPLQIVSASYDGEITMWNWKSNESPSMILRGHCRCVNTTALSSDGSKLFSGSGDPTVKVWDLVRGNCIQTISMSQEVLNLSTHGHIIATVTPDGRRFLEDLQPDRPGSWAISKMLVCKCRVGQGKMCVVGGEVTAVAFTNNGQYLASGFRDGHVEVLRTDNWTVAFEPLTELTE